MPGPEPDRSAPPVPPPPATVQETVVDPLLEVAASIGTLSRVDASELETKLAELLERCRLFTSPSILTGVGPTGISGLVDWYDILHRVGPEPDDWLLEPLVPAGRLTSIVAEAKAGKSLLLLEVALAVATGRGFLERPAADPRRVLYLDLEMSPEDLTDRAEAMGYGPDDFDTLTECLAYYQLPNLRPLDTVEGAADLLGLIDVHRPDLVVIDTLGRAVMGEENSNDTAREFYRLAARPVKARGVALVRSDHLGKDASRGARGGSAKSDDVDLEWHLTRTDGGAHLKRARSRISWAPESIDLQLVDEPPLHRQVSRSWPQGTKECAEVLEAVGVPLELSYRKARQMVREAGQSTPRDEVLRAAIKYRRQSLEQGR